MKDHGPDAAAPEVNLAPHMADEVAKTTCYMCACRCGIDVFLRHEDGGKRVTYIQGNADHPKNRGVLCAKGSAGIMQHYSPARLRAPLKRVGPRGSGEFVEITWDEALATATEWMGEIRATDPKRLAFFTGRDQSQSLTSFWAQAYGTPNYAAHGGFCSVNMATAGIYTMGGAFWEFGTPDWEHARYLMIFGVAEDHDSNPIKMGLSRLKERGARIVGVNPVRTGYNAIADDWVGITPGTDGLFVSALIHELLRTGKVDVPYLTRYTDAGWLVRHAPGTAEHGLFLRDDEGRALVLDRRSGQPVRFDDPEARPDLQGAVEGARPVFRHLIEAYLSPDYAPEAVAHRCGIPAATIRRIAAEIAEVAFEQEVVIDQPWTDWLGRHHEQMIGRPVAFHAMRGISAHSNGFQTCRAIHVLQILLGSVETPGGYRFKPPYPKPVSAHPKPHGDSAPGQPLNGPHLGYPTGPEDLLVGEGNAPKRIDKAFSWDAPLAAHGMMHMVIANAHAGDPYPIDTLFLYMANMAWNSSMNTAGTMEMLTDKAEDGSYRIPRIIYSDAYSSEMVAFADLVLPDTTYLERHDCISLLDRPISEADALGDAIRWPVVEPDRDVRGFQSVLIDLGARLGLPGFAKDGAPVYSDYADYIQRHERRPGIGPLAGFRGDGTEHGRGAPNPEQLERYKENGGFFRDPVPAEAQYFKPWNAAYQDWAVSRGLYDTPQPYVFHLYLEPMAKFQRAAEGHGGVQPPEALRERIADHFTPLPLWYPPLDEGSEDFPLHAITQRPMAMYHSWGSQNAWLRQIHAENRLYVPVEVADRAGLKDDDWARVTSRHGEITVQIRRTAAVNPHTVWTWNAIGKRKGAWALDQDAPEATRGFLINDLISELLPPKDDGLRLSNSDPITGQAAWFDLRVRIERADQDRETRATSGGRQASPVPKPPGTLAFGKGTS